MNQNKNNYNKPPEVSIDEALKLFLALTYPNGIPEEVDKDQLMDILRKKIASDRPDWAKACRQNAASTQPNEDGTTSSQQQKYSQVKANVVQDAQKEEIPEDPEERYFYQRRKEAREHHEFKKEQEKEDAIREDIRKRLIKQKKGADDAVVERAFRIRQALEQRLYQSVQTNEEKKLTQPKLVHNKPERLAARYSNETSLVRGNESLACNQGESLATTCESETTDNLSLPLLHAPVKKPMTSTLQPGDTNFKNPDLMDIDEKIEVLRQYNRERRKGMKKKEDFLSTRKPKAREKAETFSLDAEKEPVKELGNRPNQKKGLEFSDHTGHKNKGFQLR